jgi:hypothetical protein
MANSRRGGEHDTWETRTENETTRPILIARDVFFWFFCGVKKRKANQSEHLHGELLAPAFSRV